MKKCVKIALLIITLVLPYWIKAQSEEQNLLKYWYYRNRLQYFVIPGDGPGESQVCGVRNHYNNPRLDYSQHSAYFDNYPTGHFDDVAYVLNIVKRSDDDNEIVSDTIFVNENPYCMYADAIDDYQNYSYYWDLGNGSSSTDSMPCVNYPVGSYTIKLCYIDSTGDTTKCLSQTLVVIDTLNYQNDETEAVSKMLEERSTTVDKNNIKVYPNPAQNILYIINESHTPIISYKLYDLLGNEQNISLNENGSLNIGNLAPCIYFLHLNCINYETVFKITKIN